MKLSPEVANLLRQALQEAGRHGQYPSLAYAVLAEAVSNLLEPVERAEADRLFAVQAAASQLDEREDVAF